MRPRSLLTHLSLVVLVAVTLVLGLFAIYDYQRYSAQLHQELVQSLERTASRLTESVMTPLYNIDLDAVDGALRSEMQNLDVSAILIRDPASTENTRGYARAEDGSLQIIKTFTPMPELLMRQANLEYEGELLGELLVYMRTQGLKSQLQDQLVLQILQVLVLDAILVLIMIFTLKGTFVKPVVALTQLATKISEGDLQQEVEIQYQHELGDLAISLARMRDSIREKIAGLETEINQRQEVEQTLREREEDLRITLNSIGDAVIATDAEGNIARMNPVAGKLTGWSECDAVGQQLATVFNIVDKNIGHSEIDLASKMLQDEKSPPSNEPTFLISSEGLERRISSSASPIFNSRGEVVGGVLVFRDITEDHRLEEQLHQAQKMESIGLLAGGVAHDFNNMLGGIMGGAELLSIAPNQNPDNKKYIQLIIDAAERAADLNQKLLAFSRKGTVVTSPIEINNIINDSVAILERSIDRRITLIYEPHSDHLVIMADPTQIQNAIINLGINARDAMPDGGELQITTQDIQLDQAYCDASPFDLEPGLFVEISVRDTGVGMLPELQEHIFEPFFTSKETGKGTGLGLAAVYGTVRDHHGAISVYSEVDEGTMFHIYLPIAADVTLVPSEVMEAVVMGQGRILVVDDEEMIRSMATHLLESLGYEVVLANDGAEAVELYSQQWCEIDAVLLDMVMPVMNGQECFRQLRKINPEAKILISSGFTRDAAMHELQDEGLHGFLKKPYRLSELGRSLHEALII